MKYHILNWHKLGLNHAYASDYLQSTLLKDFFVFLFYKNNTLKAVRHINGNMEIYGEDIQWIYMSEYSFRWVCKTHTSWWHKIDGLVQDCSISSALAMEILQFCTKPLKWLDILTLPMQSLEYSDKMSHPSQIPKSIKIIIAIIQRRMIWW